MKWLLLLAALVPSMAQASQSWNELVTGIQQLPLPQRAEAAQKAAAEFLGPPPRDARQRRAYAENLERQRQLLLASVASVEQRALEETLRWMAAEDAMAARMQRRP